MNDEVIAAGAQKVAYGGGAMSFLGGLSANEIAAFGGLFLAFLGFVVGWYYRRKKDKRDAELHEMRKARLWEPDEHEDAGV